MVEQVCTFKDASHNYNYCVRLFSECSIILALKQSNKITIYENQYIKHQLLGQDR